MKRLFLILFFVVISNAASVLPTDIFPIFSGSEKLQGFNESNGLQSATMFAIENEAHRLQSKGEAHATAIASKKVSDQAAIAKMAGDKEAADANARAEYTMNMSKVAKETFDRSKSVAEVALNEAFSAAGAVKNAEATLLEAEKAFKQATAMLDRAKNGHVSAVHVREEMERLSKEASKNADEAEAAAKLAVVNRITANINYADAAIATERALTAARLFDECGDAEVMV